MERIDIAKNEDKFLTECSLEKYMNGNYTKGPHMVGFTSEETVSAFGRELMNIEKHTEKYIDLQ